MFETGMSALVLKICSEYAKALGLNFPPCVQQEINAIAQWVALHTVKDLKVEQDGNIVTFKFTEDKEAPTVFTIELPEEYVLNVNDLYNLIKGSTSVVVDKSPDDKTLEVRLDKSQEVQYITLSPDSATQGTLTAEQFTALQLNKGNCIILNNEIYRLSDNQHTAGIISYVHTGWDNNIVNKSINITVSTRAWTMVKGESNENFVKAFTIPNGVSTGTLTADVKAKLCNPDGHNYYVFDSTSEMILKYSFNSEDEIIQYKAIYINGDKAYDITMQILPSNGSWSRTQTVLSRGNKLYLHVYRKNIENSGDPKNTVGSVDIVFYSSSSTQLTGSEYYKTIYAKNGVARVNCTIGGGYANYTVEQTMYMNFDESKGDYTIQVNNIFNPANTTTEMTIPTLYYKEFTPSITEV